MAYYRTDIELFAESLLNAIQYTDGACSYSTLALSVQ